MNDLASHMDEPAEIRLGPEVTVNHTPSKNGFLSRNLLEDRWRQELITGLGKCIDLGTVVGAGGDSDKYKLAFPPGMLDALEKGDLRLIEAKDESGLLPTAVDASGFKRQVRITPGEVDVESLANAVAHARTQALLRQVLGQLEAIEEKLSTVLLNQQVQWRSRIAAGVKTYEDVMLEPGSEHARAASLANAHQSIGEGIEEGLGQLRVFLKGRHRPQEGWFRQLLPHRNPVREAPSMYHAATLDRVQEDITWLVAAEVTSSHVQGQLGRPRAGRERLVSQLAQLDDVLRQGREVLHMARYSEERELFWKSTLPEILGSLGRKSDAMILEFTKDELHLEGSRGDL